MNPVPIQWPELEAAFERNAPNISSYLDVETGTVLSFVDGVPEDEEQRAVVLGDESRYILVDPASSREQYRWMEHFVASIDDETLQERLIIAIDGKGAFRRFKDVLLHYPSERERWFNYRAMQTKSRPVPVAGVVRLRGQRENLRILTKSGYLHASA